MLIPLEWKWSLAFCRLKSAKLTFPPPPPGLLPSLFRLTNCCCFPLPSSSISSNSRLSISWILLPTWVFISLSGFLPSMCRLSWEPPRFSRDNCEVFSSTEFLLDRLPPTLAAGEDAVVGGWWCGGGSDGLPAVGMFLNCWKTLLEFSGVSPRSSLFVSWFNCSLRFVAVDDESAVEAAEVTGEWARLTEDRVGTARPLWTTKLLSYLSGKRNAN